MKTAKTEKLDYLKANIVIIGSGGGLAAAAAAAEMGVTGIVVLEKQKILGGHSNWAQALYACESPLHREAQILDDRDENFKGAIRHAHWARVEPRLVRAYLNKSGDTIRWFREKGVNFDLKVHYINQTFGTGHFPLKGKGPEYGRGAELIKVLTRECQELGVEIFTGTRAKKIIRGNKGEVTGVAAEKSGQEFTIKTKSVIIATGGFAGNKELLKKYCPDYSEGMHVRELSEHHTGDGLIMAAEAGAAISDYITVYLEAPHPNYKNTRESLASSMKEPIAGIIKEPYTVWVNKKGRRFIDETAGFNLFESGNAGSRQPDRVLYSLFDDQIRQDVEEKGMLTGRGWGKEEKGQRIAVPGLEAVLKKRSVEGEDSLVKIADSWDDIADWIGAKPEVLKAEIEEYNTYCEHGYDQVFIKDRKHLRPLLKTPFYAIRCITSLGGTTGGIKVNERLEALDKNLDTIPGLYAAGVIADGWQGQTPAVESTGGPFTFAFNSGRIAGENAARFVGGK
jgi:fumarate reductase flavoprotein subunit